jgi:hypothetical protein
LYRARAFVVQRLGKIRAYRARFLDEHFQAGDRGRFCAERYQAIDKQEQSKTA